MLVYAQEKHQFLADVRSNYIAKKMEDLFYEKFQKRVAKKEVQSWENSLGYMHRLLTDDGIPSDAGVALEMVIHNTSKRIDFILTGLNEQKKHSAIIIELKQWSEAFPLDGVEALLQVNPDAEISEVQTYLGKGKRETTHPSRQAWSYRTLLADFNKSVEDIPILLTSCAYLHNYEPKANDPLKQPYFADYLDESPLFYKSDVDKLTSFIKKYIRYGDQKQTLYYIEQGEIRPSKSLQESLSAMLKGNKEFTLIDEQEIAYQKILAMSRKSQKDGKKRVFIVHGGPGTGKTVIAINLLTQLTKENQVCAYVTKNSAPRNVFEAKLRGEKFKRKNISAMFKSSSAFINAETNDFGTLIVDEAHRLQQRSQLGGFVGGEDQIKEIMAATRCAVFFIDEQQKVTAQDYGERKQILKWANRFNAEVEEGHLVSQFRCNGSDGYLSWLDWTLGISNQSANTTLEGIDYDFQVFDDPHALRQAIEKKNQHDNKSRLVAGYCWNWISKKNPHSSPDVVIDDFGMYWNLSSDKTYAISTSSIDQIGCIHTTQGLEFGYVGVIIGDDLTFKEGTILTDYTKRAKTDKSLHGLLGKARKGDSEALVEIDAIIRNTYRTLMSRGMKGCYVYCTDSELSAYLKRATGRYDGQELPPLQVADSSDESLL